MDPRPAGRACLVEPRGLSREQAAFYVGVGTSKFDEMVADGRMPGPKEIDRRRVWDRRGLDAAFDNLPTSEAANPWDRKRVTA